MDKGEEIKLANDSAVASHSLSDIEHSNKKPECKISCGKTITHEEVS